MKTLVTGATGLVGSQVVKELLARGEAVRALARDPSKANGLHQQGVDVMAGDICDPAVVVKAMAGVDVVQHCAAAVGPQFSKREIYETNLNGVRNVLEACRRAGGARLVLVSSVNVLGTRNLDPATEELPCRRSHDPAADVKIEAEQLAREYHGHGVDVTIVRPGFIYGPGDKHNLPRLVRAIGRGKFAFLGSRDNVVPIVHVEDVAQGLLLAGTIAAARGRVYNITDGTRTTIGELATYLAELLGCPPPTRRLPYFVPYVGCVIFEWLGKIRQRRRPPPITRAALRFLGTSRFVDIRRARAELGYRPRVLYRDGMAATLPWIKEHLGEADHGISSARENP